MGLPCVFLSNDITEFALGSKEFSHRMPSVLFVCLGNICRSPLAEAAFRKTAEQSGLDVHVDSAGTGDWHVGHPPDARAQAVALRNGIDISHYRGRQVGGSDFARFTHIIALDHSNLRDLKAMAGRPVFPCCLIMFRAVRVRRLQIPITVMNRVLTSHGLM
jgi:protein-tyrosine phosphatase